MADIAGPTILSVERINGYQIRITFSLGSSNIDRVYADVRTLTGSWAQGNAKTLPGTPEIVVASRAGVALDANTEYQVKLRARHTSNQPVAESNTVNVAAWEVATPTLLAAVRTSPGQILITYEGATPAAGGRLYVERRTTPSGSWGQVTSFVPSSAGNYPIAAEAGASYEVRVRSGQYGVYSDYSSARSVNAWETSTPNVTGATRTGQSTADITYTGAIAGGVLVLQRRVQGASAWTTVTPGVGTPSTSGTYTMTGLVGATKYEVRAFNSQSNVSSGYSSERSLDAWFSPPASVSDLSVSRRSDGTVDLTWTGSPTTRAPYVGQRVYRAEGDLGQLAVLPAGSIAGGLRSFRDLTAKAEKDYRYSVAPYNTAGESTSKPVVSTKASILAPAAPSATTAVWVSDTTADVSWPDSATLEKPVTKYLIRRWLLGAWSPVGEVPGGTLTWRDKGLSKNSVYRYQVQAQNTAGKSVTFSPDSADVVTTPTGASSVAAGRSGLDVKVSWVAPSGSIASSWSVDHTTDPNPATATEDKWFPITAGTLAGSARTVTHVGATGGAPHTYRVRPTRTGAPVAPWVLSNTLSQFVTPNPPTLLPVEQVDASGPITFRWVYNSVDGTPQWSSEVQYRVAGTSTWTRNPLNFSDQESYVLPAGTLANGQTIEWIVEVESIDAGAATSAVSSFVTRARPTVSITFPPSGIHASSTLTVAWATASQSSWAARLLDGNGNVVDSKTGTSSSARTATFTGLRDRGAYTVEVTVRDAYQESLPASVAFTVELDRPASPPLSAEVDVERGSVLLTATPVQGLKLSRYSWAPPVAGWTTYGTGEPAARAVVQVAGVERSALLLAPGQTYQSPPITVPAMLAGLTSSVLATAMSTSAPGEVRVDYIDAGGTNTATGPGTATVAGVPVTVYGDLFESWPAGWRIAVTNTGTEPLYVWDAWGIARAGSDDASFFDGDTRRDGFTYGWNSDGTAYEAVPVSDPAEADFPVALTTRIEIIRINPDGTAYTIGNIGEDGSLTDPLPPLGVNITYIARAWTTAPAYADSAPATVRLDNTGVIVNYGPGWSGLAIVKANLGFNVETSTDVELVHFDRDTGGPNLPVAYGSGTATHTVAVSGATDYELGSTEAEWDLVSGQLLVWYRDPEGRTFPASVPAVRFGQEHEGSRTLSFTASEVDATGWMAEAAPKPKYQASTFDFAEFFSEGIAV